MAVKIGDRTHTVQAALDALQKLQSQRPGTRAKLILYPDGEGAAVWEAWDGTFRAAVDFDERADLLEVVKKLANEENLLEE